MSKRLVVWLWLSVASVVVGAYLLYPIGSTGMNVLFFLWKAGMLSGLLSLLAGSKRWGFVVWAVCSAGAIAMTCLKIANTGVSFLTVASIVVDILMPTVAVKQLF